MINSDPSPSVLFTSILPPYPFTMNTFYVTNVVALFLGIACAEAGWSYPTFSLIFPALMIVNALFFHILPYIRSNRKFSPGLITAIFLFLPVGLGSFNMAIDMGVHARSITIAAICGVLTMIFPLFLLKTKELSFFKL